MKPFMSAVRNEVKSMVLEIWMKQLIAVANGYKQE